MTKFASVDVLLEDSLAQEGEGAALDEWVGLRREAGALEARQSALLAARLDALAAKRTDSWT